MTYIGIDPDIRCSGVAVVKDGSIGLFNMTLQEILADALSRPADSTVYVVEASWLIGSANWHLRQGNGRRVSSAMGYDIGRNHQIGIDIVCMLRHLGFDVMEKKPLRKIWAGRDGKITHDELVRITRMKQRRSNQEQRDALLLVWTEIGK